MKTKRIFKILGILTLWCIFFGSIITLFIAAKQKSDALTCQDFRFNIDRYNGVSFVDTSDVKTALKEIGSLDLKNRRINEINIQKIEKHLEKNPHVDNAELFITRNGILNINITQRKPLLRVFNSDGVSFYLSNKNEVIPWSKKYSAHVPVLLGLKAGALDFYNKKDSIIVNKLCDFARYVESNSFWKAQIDQIILKENNEIEIIPTLGENTIYFGDIDNYEEKLDNLFLFYKKNIKNKNFLEKYENINLAYKDQIVCKNKINLKYEPTDSTTATAQ